MAKLKTGRHTSALKAQRQAERHAESNVEIRSQINTIARKVEAAVSKKDAKSAKTLLGEAFKVWDKAAKVGVIHQNAASRKKARLSSRVHKLSATTA